MTYVNGGVFFARGTRAVARLFEDAWALVSQDLGTLNEQDCLNRMLLASNLRWAPLSPRLFPNGYVYWSGLGLGLALTPTLTLTLT